VDEGGLSIYGPRTLGVQSACRWPVHGRQRGLAGNVVIPAEQVLQPVGGGGLAALRDQDAVTVDAAIWVILVRSISRDPPSESTTNGNSQQPKP
jgi:hypothetical protein